MTPQEILKDLFPGDTSRFIWTHKNGAGYRTEYAKDKEDKYIPLTKEAYSIHTDFDNPKGIGVCPNINGYCKFTTIDIDNPRVNIKKLNQRIQILGLPLVLYKSKSKGAHLVMEFKELVEVKKALKVMKIFQKVLDCWSLKVKPGVEPVQVMPEIFPKGDNRINLPYFYYNGEITRKALGPKDEELTVYEAHERAELLRQDNTSINLYYLLGTKGINGQYDINFNVALYYKRREPENWKELLKKFNEEHIVPPTEDKWIEHIVSSHDKKDYDWQKELGKKEPSAHDLFYENEQTEFFKNVWYVKKDDRFWDNSTNDEYKKEAINIAYGKIFEAPVVKKFQSNPNAIIVERFVYRPDLYKPGEKIIEENGLKYINTYWPSDLESIKPTPDLIRPFFVLLSFLVPNKIEREWLLDFLCTIVQYPGRKIRHSILIYSKEFQIGKSSLFKLIMKVLGLHNCSVIGPNQATDKGKGFLVNKQLVLIDEIKSKDDWGERNTLLNDLKPMMTEDLHEVRPLWKDYRTVRTCTNYFLFTNYENAISLPQNEVRYTVFENLSKRMEDKFYADFHKQLKEGLLANVVKYYLQKRTISENFKAEGTNLKTKALAKMSEEGAHETYKEVKRLMTERSAPFEQDVVSINEVWAHLRKNNGVRGRSNELAKAMEKLGCVRLGDGARHVHSGRYPTLWAVRNVEFYLSKTTKEVTDDYWIPLDCLAWGIREAEIGMINSHLKEVEPYMESIGKPFDKSVYENETPPPFAKSKFRETVCWSCRKEIDTESNEKCPECNYAIRCTCGMCACDKPGSKIPKKYEDPPF